MEEGIAAADHRQEQANSDAANMPNFGALADMHSSLSNMGKMRKQQQMKDLGAKLGVEVTAADLANNADDLTNILIQRAKEGGKTEADIAAALE